MGVGIELLFFVALLLVAGYIIYRVVSRGRQEVSSSDGTRADSKPMRLALFSAGIGLIIVIALTVEFCQEKNDLMDKNTSKDNSVDNIGKGENEDDNRDDGDDTQR